MDRLLFVVSNALVLHAAWSLSRIALPHAAWIERVLGVIAGVPIVALPVMLALGATGTLRVLPAIVAVGAIAVGLGLWACRDRPPATAPAEHRRPWEAVLLGAVAGIVAWQLHPLVVRHALRGMSLHWDDLSYHAPMPAHWLQAERLVLAPFNYHAYYAGNAELFAAWFMLPTRLDGFAALATLHWLLLAAASVAAICIRLGTSAAGAAFGVVALLACKPFAQHASSFAAVDLAGTALCGASLAIALGATRAPDPRGDDLLGRAFYVACLTGLAIGAKISFAPFGLVAVACVLAPLVTRDRRTLATGLTLGATSMLACGVYWYARNLWLTDNPLFPAQVAFFDGPLDREAQRQTTLWLQLREELGPAGLTHAWKKLLDWPRDVAYVWLAGYAAALLALVLPASWREPSARRASIVLVAGLVVAAFVCITPFSGTVNARGATLDVRLRFFLPIALLGVPLAAAALDRVHALRPLPLVGASAYLVHAARMPVGPVLVAALAGAVLWLGLRVLPRTVVTRAVPVAVWLTCLALPVAAERALVVKQPLQDEAVRKVVPAWKAIDRLPKGARIAWFSTFDGYKYYPAFGHGLVHVPVAVEPDGSRYRFLHEDWREFRPTWWKAKGRKREMQDLVANLQRQRIDYVFLMKRHAGPWPKQFDLLEESKRAKLVLRRRSAALFRIPRA